MARKVWVQGPIAIDSVVYLSQFPVPGSFMNSLRTEERTGGSSANVALGLCTASVETGLVLSSKPATHSVGALAESSR